MEPVSEEFVEQYFDFFFRLSDEQLKERIKEYKKKQINIYLRIERMAMGFRTPEKKTFLWKTSLLITFCFESYETKIPEVSEKLIIKINNEVQKRAKELIKTSEQNSFFALYLEQINQPHFFKFIESKMKYLDQEKGLLNKDESTTIYNHMVILGQFYLRAMEKKKY